MKRKQKRDDLEGSAKATKLDESNKKDITLPSLWTLPEEIRSYLIGLICGLGPQDEAEARSAQSQDTTAAHLYSWRVDLDLGTVRSLTLVSREFHSYFNPLLWAHIRITHPSALTQLHDALLSRPSNGLLVKSLHLGPLDDLHEYFWPALFMRTTEDEKEDGDDSASEEDRSTLFFKTGWTDKEEAMRPRWCEGDRGFPFHKEPNDRHERAVYRAISTAMSAIGIDSEMNGDFFNEEHTFIGIAEWTKRVFDVQGTLDLYLHRMRQIDDAASAKAKTVQSYPRLVIEGFESRKEAAAKDHASANRSIKRSRLSSEQSEIFVVTRAQIRSHLKRAGAHLDHFDHPLIFARDEDRYLASTWKGEVVVNVELAERSNYVGDASREEFYGARGPWRDGIPVLGRSVVEHTPKIKNLSLTGLFWQMMQDERPRPRMPLPEMISLSLGPLTPPYKAGICLSGGVDFPAMEKLRVCGATPGIMPACLVAGDDEGFPQLKVVHWDCGHRDIRYADEEDLVCKHFNIMRGADETAEPDPESMRKRNTRHSLYVEARLHPEYVSAFLNKASTPQIRNALMEGSPAADALHRLRVLESRASKDAGPFGSDYDLEKYDVLREEGKQWWRECALEVERRKRQGRGRRRREGGPARSFGKLAIRRPAPTTFSSACVLSSCPFVPPS